MRIAFVVPHARESSIPLDLAERIARSREREVTLFVVWTPDEEGHHRLERISEEGDISTVVLGASSLRSLPLALQKAVIRSKRGYDIVHAHHTVSILIGLVIAQSAGIPLVITNHGRWENHRLRKKLVKIGAFPFSHVVSNSVSTERSYDRSLCKPRSWSVVYNGVPCSRLRPGERSLKGAFDQNALWVGRCVESKDLMTAAVSFRRLQDRRRDIGLHIVGEGPTLAQVRDYVESNDVQNVFFYGGLPRSEVYELLWDADLFVLTSLSEGFCNALVEAMCARCCVVSTNIEPIRSEILGDCGKYFPPQAPDALADLLVELGPDEVQSLGRESRRVVKDRFTLKQCAAAYSEYYAALTR